MDSKHRIGGAAAEQGLGGGREGLAPTLAALRDFLSSHCHKHGQEHQRELSGRSGLARSPEQLRTGAPITSSSPPRLPEEALSGPLDFGRYPSNTVGGTGTVLENRTACTASLILSIRLLLQICTHASISLLSQSYLITCH